MEEYLSLGIRRCTFFLYINIFLSYTWKYSVTFENITNNSSGLNTCFSQMHSHFCHVLFVPTSTYEQYHYHHKNYILLEKFNWFYFTLPFNLYNLTVTLTVFLQIVFLEHIWMLLPQTTIRNYKNKLIRLATLLSITCKTATKFLFFRRNDVKLAKECWLITISSIRALT